MAGPTLAYWLRVGGFQPTLIEHAPAVRNGGYVVDFWGLGYDIADRMGLENELNRVGYHIGEMRIVNDRGGRIAGFGTKVFLELTGGRYVTIARSALSRVLVEKIGNSVEMIFGAAAIPGFASIAFGRSVVDRLKLPEYSWGVCPAE